MHTVVSVKPNLPVVVGIDGSRNHLAAVDLATAEAVLHETPLRIVHVWPGRYAGPLRSRGGGSAEEDGRHLLEIAARRAEHNAPGLSVTTELANGSVVGLLVQRSSEARLLVVSHRDEMLTHSGWGSTAAYLAHHSECPLLVHRGTGTPRGPVVLAASACRSTTATVGCGYEEASLRAARLVAVHVWTHPTGRRTSSPLEVAGGYAADRDEAERTLAEALAGWTSRYPDVPVERLVLHDLDVAYTLERASRRARLLVAGIGRNGRFAELLYGSLGSALVRQPGCPVLLVPPGWQHPVLSPRLEQLHNSSTDKL